MVMLSVIILSVALYFVILSVFMLCVLSHFYGDAECHSGKCRGANKTTKKKFLFHSFRSQNRLFDAKIVYFFNFNRQR
jgi:hypothetical protein